MSESKSKASVLYLSYDGMTDPLGQSQVLSYLIHLSGQGYDIDILSYEKPDVFPEQRKRVEELIRDTNIAWHPLSYTKKPPILSTLKDLRAGWKRVKVLLAKKHYDIVHCRGYITPFLGRKCKKQFGTKYIFDMRGWWPDEKLESGLWEALIYRPVYHFFKNQEKKHFVESDYSISLTYAGKAEIERLSYLPKDKIGVIPTCVNFDVFKPFDKGIRDKVKKILEIPESAKVLLYSGSLGGNYGTDILLEIFKALKRLDGNSILLILSKTDKEYIRGELKSSAIDEQDVRMVNAEYHQVHEYLMVGDVGVITYKRAFSVIGRSPTKLGEYWACGLPVLALSGIGDVDYLVKKYRDSGALIDKLTQADYEEALAEVFELKISQTQLRQYAIDYFDLQKGVEQYDAIYQTVLNE